MTAVTFPNGNGYSDDGTTAHDMRNGGHRTNLLPMIGDTITVANSAITAAAQAVPAAASATTDAATATAQAAIAVAAANTAAGIVQVKQPSEIAGIDPILDFPFRASTAVPSGVITGSSGKWVTNQAGVLVNVPAGTAPIDFDPVTSALRGLLVEEARTNLLSYSEQFENAAWSSTGAVVTPNAAAAPNGVTSADLWVPNSGVDAEIIRTASVTVAAGADFAISGFFKAAGAAGVALLASSSGNGFRAALNLSTGAVVSSGALGTGTYRSSGVVALGGGWYRFWVSGQLASGVTSGQWRIHITNASGTNINGDGTSGVYIWGAQLEAGSFATSYAPTVGSAVTRPADVNPASSLSSIPGWNANEGTIYLEARTALGSGTQTYAQYDDGTNNNRIAVYRDSSNVLRCIVVVSGSTAVNLSLGTVANDTAFKVAFGWKANSFAASLNGAVAVTATSGAIPSGLTTHRIGHDATGNYANAPLRRDEAFPRRIADATLALMSA